MPSSRGKKKGVRKSKKTLSYCQISERQLSSQSDGAAMIGVGFWMRNLTSSMDEPVRFCTPARVRSVSAASLPMSGGSVPSSRGKKRVLESRRKLCHIFQSAAGNCQSVCWHRHDEPYDKKIKSQLPGLTR